MLFTAFDGIVTVKPKAHYLIHYPAQIRLCGAPIDHGTIRFERKHDYFKNVYNRSNNRINLAKSLAKHHQYLMYLHYKKDDILEYDRPQTTFTRTVDISDFELEVQNLIKGVGMTKARCVNFDDVTWEGNTYQTKPSIWFI